MSQSRESVAGAQHQGQEAGRGEHVLGGRAPAWHVGARGEMAHSVATTCCRLGSPGRCTAACSGRLQAAPRPGQRPQQL